jgi:hypothetical protein
MVFGLLLNVGIIALVVYGVRTLRQRRSSAPIGHQLRNVFQYIVLLALTLATASGLSGLLGMVADRADLVAADSSELALNLSLLLVGTPLLFVIGWWTRKRITKDPSETSTAGWTLFITVGLVASVVVALFGLYETVLFLLQSTEYDGFALMQALVWSGASIALHRIDRRTAPREHADLRHVVLALIGLGLAAVGFGRLIAALIDRVVQPGSQNTVMVSGGNFIAEAAALFVIAVPVWIIYWQRGLAQAPESEGWRLHVVLFGVAGGLVTAIVSGANLLYLIAVWYLGSPKETEIGDHFQSLPNVLGAAAAGLLVWWYHRTVLAHRGRLVRGEIDRTYTYVMSSGGLIASGVGVVILLSALVEAITGRELVRGDSGLNTLIFALVVLVIGLPVWWYHWHAAESFQSQDKVAELASVSRRVYLISLLGVGGLIALGSGIATVYVFLQDLIEGELASSTLRSIRFPLAILITSGAIAAYHFGLYRRDHQGRAVEPTVARKRSIVLVGPRDEGLDRMIRETGSIDLRWITTKSGSWSLDEVRALITDGPTNMAIALTESGARASELTDH